MQQSVFDLARKDGVSTDVYAYGAILASVLFDERLYNSRIHDDKAIKRLRTARCRYTNLIHNISNTRTRLSEFLNTCEALLTAVVRVAVLGQITPAINALYMVLTISTQIAVTAQTTINAEA